MSDSAQSSSDLYEIVVCGKHQVGVPRVSHRDARLLGIQFGCALCNQDLASRRSASTMTPEERVAEMLDIVHSPLMSDFDLIQHRLSELVGRSILTHEMAYPDLLEKEIREGEPTLFDSIERIAEGKEIIIVEAE